MAKRMSCSMTIDAVKERRKTVTRRHVDTWQNLAAGDHALLDQRQAGLPKGARQVVPVLLDVPAPVRFLSCEPLLGPVSLAPWLHEGVGWVIVGGESGPKHRPLDLEDARIIRDECEEAGVPFLFKQVGGYTPTAGGDLLDGRAHKGFPTSPAEF